MIIENFGKSEAKYAPDCVIQIDEHTVVSVDAQEFQELGLAHFYWVGEDVGGDWIENETNDWY